MAEQFAIVDPARSVPLDSVGGSGWTVVVAVDVNGDEHWGVVDRACYGNPALGFTRATPDHERLGAWRISEPKSEPTDGHLGHRAMRWPDNPNPTRSAA